MARVLGLLNNRPILRRVSAFVARHPRLSTAVAASPIAPLGDLFCQTLEISWSSSFASPTSPSSPLSPASSSLPSSSPSPPSSSPPTLSDERSSMWLPITSPSSPKKTSIDWQRFGAAAVFGACVSAPIGVWWFPWVDKVVKRHASRLVEGSFSFVMLKTVAEGVLIGPPFTISYFVIVSAIQGGEKWATLIPRMKQDALATNLGDQAWWLFVAPINYKFVPVHCQVFFSNIATAIEMMAFSWIQHNRTVAVEPAVVPECGFGRPTETETDE